MLADESIVHTKSVNQIQRFLDFIDYIEFLKSSSLSLNKKNQKLAEHILVKKNIENDVIANVVDLKNIVSKNKTDSLDIVYLQRIQGESRRNVEKEIQYLLSYSESLSEKLKQQQQ